MTSMRRLLWIGLPLAVIVHSSIIVFAGMVPRGSDMFFAWLAWYLLLAVVLLLVTVIAGFVATFWQRTWLFGTGLLIGAFAAPGLWIIGAAIQAAAVSGS